MSPQTGSSVELRAAESESRPKAASALKNTAENYLAIARSEAPSHAHIESGDRAVLTKEAEAALSWLGEWKLQGVYQRTSCYEHRPHHDMLCPVCSTLVLGRGSQGVRIWPCQVARTRPELHLAHYILMFDF